MKKYYIICFLFFLLSCSDNKNSIKDNNINSDSLTYYLDKAGNDKLSYKLKHLYYKKALIITGSVNNDSISRAKLLEITLWFFNHSKWKDFFNSSRILLNKAIESKDILIQAQVYRYKASYYKKQSINDSAFIYYLKAEKLFRQKKDRLNLGNILSNKSIVQFNIGDYVGADKSLTQAYKNLKDLNHSEKLFVVFTMMGIVASETKDYEKSIVYYNKSLKIIRDNNLNINYQEATCLNNLGYAYQSKGEYTEAINKFKLALKDKTIYSENPELYSLLVDNLGYSKFRLNDFKDLPNLFYESLKLRENLNLPTLIILSNIHLSEFYAAQKDTSMSQKHARIALDLAKKNNIIRDLLAALKQISVVDFKNASKYSSDYIRINDSIQNVERASKEKFSRLELETDEITQEKNVLEDKNRTLLYIFIITTVLASLLFVVRAQRARTRELLLKQAQQKANEEIFNLMMSQQSIIDESRNKEKKRLAQDLHDGVLGRMFGLRLNLDSLNSSNEQDAVEKRHELLNELKTIEQDIREISHDLNREKLVLINNFVSIVHNLLEDQKSLHEANVTYEIDTTINWDKIGNAIKINMYRMLQEGLQNINKYAQATNITVQISGNSENVFLKIEDDGIGFDVNKKSKGIGMQNMISRTNDCQGIIDISSKKEEGTKIVITIPIETKKLNPEQV